MRAVRFLSTALSLVLALATVAGAADKMPWQPNLETAQKLAAQTNRLVLVHFWAPWCRPCMRLEKEVFSHPDTAKALEANFVLVKLNVDDSSAVARGYGVSSLPSDVIITPAGRLVSQIQSPPSANQYVTQMNQAAAGHRALARPAASPALQQAAAAAPGSPANVLVSAPGTQATAPPAGERYAEFYNQQPAAAPRSDANVAQTQAYAAPVAQPPANPYAQPNAYPQANAYAQAPPADPYAAAPAANAYAPPANAYAGAPPVATAPPTTMTPPTAVAAPGLAPAAPPVAAPPARTVQIQLPPGCPPLGLEGNCPVTLVERQDWVLGVATFGAVHRGRTYLFLGPSEREKFLADPDRYSPVLSGIDPVMALDNRGVVPGRREFGVFGADGHIYLFADAASRERFEQNEKHYATEVMKVIQR